MQQHIIAAMEQAVVTKLASTGIKDWLMNRRVRRGRGGVNGRRVHGLLICKGRAQAGRQRASGAHMETSLGTSLRKAYRNRVRVSKVAQRMSSEAESTTRRRGELLLPPSG